MHDSRQRFIDFLVEFGVLTFGDFTTKRSRWALHCVKIRKHCSGSKPTPYGRASADAIKRFFPQDLDGLFVPARRGIPLVVASPACFLACLLACFLASSNSQKLTCSLLHLLVANRPTGSLAHLIRCPLIQFALVVVCLLARLLTSQILTSSLAHKLTCSLA